MTQEKKYTPEELADILAQHAKWARGDKDGARANLAGANLADANLADANLARANLKQFIRFFDAKLIPVPTP